MWEASGLAKIQKQKHSIVYVIKKPKHDKDV